MRGQRAGSPAPRLGPRSRAQRDVLPHLNRWDAYADSGPGAPLYDGAALTSAARRITTFKALGNQRGQRAGAPLHDGAVPPR